MTYLILPVERSQTRTSWLAVPFMTLPPQRVEIATETEFDSGFHFLKRVPLCRS